MSEEVKQEEMKSQKKVSKKRPGIIEAVILFLKGIVVGIANIIPGVSGGTICVITGIFDRLIEALNTLFKKFRENIKFLLPVGIGCLAGIVGLAKVMEICLEKYTLPTNFFFVGLVIGSIPLIFSKTKEAGKTTLARLIPFVIAAFAVIALAVVQTYVLEESTSASGVLPEITFGNIVKFFFGGVIGAAAMVVPGISGSLVMVLVGLYDKVIAAISGITSFGNTELMLKSLLILLPFGVGVVAGIFTVAKLIEWLLKKFRSMTYHGILGLMWGSLIALIINLRLADMSFPLVMVAVSAVTCVLGFLTSFFLGRE